MRLSRDVATGVFKSSLEYSMIHSLRDSLSNETEVSTRIRCTEDRQEGRRSFIEKRKPVFKGR